MGRHGNTTESVRLNKKLVAKIRGLAKKERRWVGAMADALIEEALEQRRYLKRFARQKLKENKDKRD